MYEIIYIQEEETMLNVILDIAERMSDIDTIVNKLLVD